MDSPSALSKKSATQAVVEGGRSTADSKEVDQSGTLPGALTSRRRTSEGRKTSGGRGRCHSWILGILSIYWGSTSTDVLLGPQHSQYHGVEDTEYIYPGIHSMKSLEIFVEPSTRSIKYRKY